MNLNILTQERFTQALLYPEHKVPLLFGQVGKSVRWIVHVCETCLSLYVRFSPIKGLSKRIMLIVLAF